MNQKHLWVTSVALAVLFACGAREGNGTGDETQGVGEGAQRGEDETEQTEAVNDSAAGAEQAAYVGSWHLRAAEPDSEMFIVLEAERGVMCASDGKSQAQFDLVHSGNTLSMGSYAYGGGDELQIVDGDVLQRTTEEKGATYVATYERWEEELPSWCQEQLAELK